MPELVYLSRREVAALLPTTEAQLRLVEDTYRAMAEDGADVPPKPAIHPRPDSFIHAMPAYVRHEDVAAIKWIAAYRRNKAIGLPYLSGLIIVNDAETGLPVAVMDASEITAARTAVASGVCVRRWAPAGWRRAAIVGWGVQGRCHAEVVASLNPDASIAVFDPQPVRIAKLEGPLEPAVSVRDAIDGADVVITAAPMLERADPTVSADWIQERSLLLPIDFDASVKADAIRAADVFLVDDVAQFEHYRARGHFEGWPSTDGSVGSWLDRGVRPDRVACVNLGVGALDAVFANAVMAEARRAGVGTLLPL